MSQGKPVYKGILCSIGAAVGFGCGSTVLKVIYQQFGQIPFQDLSFIRSVACAVAFFAVLVKKDRAQFKITKREFAFFAFAGACGLFVVQFFLLLALRMIPVGVCSFVQSSSTLMVCACSVLLFHENISKSKGLGIGIGLCGLAFVVWQRVSVQAGHVFVLGILCALLSGVGKTVYLLCGKAAAQKGRRYAMMAYGMLICALMHVPFISGPAQILRYFEEVQVGVFLLLYLLFCSILPYILTFRAIALLPASTAGSLNVVEPVAGTVSAFLILGEPVACNQIMGAALIVVSVYLIHRDAGRCAAAEADAGGKDG